MICQYFEVHSKVGLIVGRGNDYHGKMLAVCCVHLARKRPCINKPNSSEVCNGFKSVNETHDVICSN